MNRFLSFAISLVLAACGGGGGGGGAGETAVAPAVEDGTPANPYVVAAFPFVQDNDTSKSPASLIDSYSAAPATDESGPELYYRITIAKAGTFKAEVLEAAGVDVDLHLLSALDVEAGVATKCTVRANTQITVSLAAGTYHLVVDSYVSNGTVRSGAFKLAIEHDVPDEWQTVPVKPGIVWRKKVYTNYAGGAQTVNVLEIAADQVVVKPFTKGGAMLTSKEAAGKGAVAAINGGFFASDHSSLCLVKVDGVLKSTNQLGTGSQPSFGFGSDGAAMFQPVAPNSDWPAAQQALAGHPNLVTNGQVDVWPAGTSTFYTSKHPRTALGITKTNKLLLVTVDGRTSAGKGMTISELAQYLKDLGAWHAFNLDGGGSTTMFVSNQSINGIVNHPSDNGKPDHWGERPVSDALFLY